jgi:hypothetical protein
MISIALALDRKHRKSLRQCRGNERAPSNEVQVTKSIELFRYLAAAFE